MGMMPETTIGKLRVWALLEGLSLLLLLFVAMPLKYIWHWPEGVQYIGAAHGGLFIFYCIWLLVATLEVKWGLKVAALVFIAAFLPFGTLVADRKIFKYYVPEKEDKAMPEVQDEEGK